MGDGVSRKPSAARKLTCCWEGLLGGPEALADHIAEVVVDD